MVIVFGGINVDGVLTAAHLPGAGETVVGATYATYPGGKGANQAVAAAHYGAKVAMVGCTGDDALAEIPMAAFDALGVDTSRVVKTTKASTAYASVWVDSNGENQIIVASGANFLATAAQCDSRVLAPGNTLLLQLEVNLAENENVAVNAAAAGCRVILNAAPYTPVSARMLNATDVLVVNEIEATGLAETFGTSAEHIVESANALARDFSLTVVVTLGPKGAIVTDGNLTTEIPALDVTVTDTTGAGDTFCGTLASALDQGEPFDEAVALSCIAGSLSCTKLGAQSGMPTRDEVRSRFC